MAKLWPHAHDLPLILPFWHWRQKRRPGKLRRAEGCLVAYKAVYVMRPIARTQPYTCAILIIESRGQTTLQARRWLAHRRLRSGGGARPSNPSKFPEKWRREHLVARLHALRYSETWKDYNQAGMVYQRREVRPDVPSSYLAGHKLS